MNEPDWTFVCSVSWVGSQAWKELVAVVKGRGQERETHISDTTSWWSPKPHMAFLVLVFLYNPRWSLLLSLSGQKLDSGPLFLQILWLLINSSLEFLNFRGWSFLPVWALSNMPDQLSFLMLNQLNAPNNNNIKHCLPVTSIPVRWPQKPLSSLIIYSFLLLNIDQSRNQDSVLSLFISKLDSFRSGI